jgi:dynein heavy chain, axonemal
MQVAINLADAYEKAFEHTRRQLMTQPKGKQFDFNKDKIFEKFNIFKRRLEKLVDMFKTIHQFSSLEQHTHIEGLSDMIANFNNITDNVRMKVCPNSADGSIGSQHPIQSGNMPARK